MSEHLTVRTEPIIRYLLAVSGQPVPEHELPPDSSNAWSDILCLASRMKVDAWIADAVLRTWRNELSADLIRSLEQRLTVSRQRTLGLLVQIRHLGAMLSTADIPFILLKGGAVLARGWYGLGCRTMTDLDIMVPYDALDRAVAVLQSQGYRTWNHSCRQVHHSQVLQHGAAVAPVEVHVDPYPLLPESRCFTAAVWECAITMPVLGVHMCVPEVTDHAWILMRTDLLSRPCVPRLSDVIEFSCLVNHHPEVDILRLMHRALAEGVPGVVHGMMHALAALTDGDMASLPVTTDWRIPAAWSLHTTRKNMRGSRFASARDRFAAVLLYPSPAFAARFRFVRLMVRMTGYIDHYGPGPWRQPGALCRVYRTLKVLVGMVVGLEYLILLLTGKLRRLEALSPMTASKATVPRSKPNTE